MPKTLLIFSLLIFSNISFSVIDFIENFGILPDGIHLLNVFLTLSEDPDLLMAVIFLSY